MLHKIISDQIKSALIKDKNNTFDIIGGVLSLEDIIFRLNDSKDFLVQITKNTPDMCMDKFNNKEIPVGERFKPYSELRENIINTLLNENSFSITNKFSTLQSEIESFIEKRDLTLINTEFRGGNPKNGVWILTYKSNNNSAEHKIVFKYCAPVFPNKKKGQVENEQFWQGILELLNLPNAKFKRSQTIDNYELAKPEADRAGAFFMNYIYGNNSDKITRIIDFPSQFTKLITQFAKLMAVSDVFGKSDRRPNFFGANPMDGQYRVTNIFTVYPLDNDYLWESLDKHHQRLLLEAKQANSESSILLFGRNLKSYSENKKIFKENYLEIIKQLQINRDRIIKLVHEIYKHDNYLEKEKTYKENLDFYGREEWIDEILDNLTEGEHFLQKLDISIPSIRS